MFGIGMPEMLLLLALALIIIGPKKLPDLARSLGRAMREFKKATNELKETLDIDEDMSEVKSAFNDLKKDTSELITGTGSGRKETAQADSGQIEADVETMAADAPAAADAESPPPQDIGTSEEVTPAERKKEDEPSAEQKREDLKKAFDDWSAEKSPADTEQGNQKPKEPAEDA